MAARARVSNRRITPVVWVSAVVGGFAFFGVGLWLIERSPSLPAVPQLARTLTPAAVEFIESEENRVESATAGRYVCAARPLGASHAPSLVRIYVWVMCGTYRRTAEGKIVGYPESSDPAVVLFTLDRQGRYRAMREVVPGEAPQFSADVKRLFPSSLSSHILSMDEKLSPGVNAVLTRAKIVLGKRP